MQYIVLGAAGFIGSHLVDALLAQGHSVIGLDNLSSGRLENLRGALYLSRFHFSVHDIRNPLPAWAPVVFNLACPAAPLHYQTDPLGTLETSVVGTLRLIEAAKRRPFLIVHASTSEVYGNPTVFPQPESYVGNVNPIGLRSCYPEGKRAAESLLFNAQLHQFPRIARLFNVYGPRMAANDGRVVPAFIDAAVNGRPLTVHGDGSQTRSFCYVDDLVRGLLTLGDVDFPDYGIFNLGSDHEITVLALAELVLRLSGLKSDQIELVGRPSDDPDRRCPDLAKARQLLGYEPQISLEQGLCLLLAQARAAQRRPEFLLDHGGALTPVPPGKVEPAPNVPPGETPDVPSSD